MITRLRFALLFSALAAASLTAAAAAPPPNVLIVLADDQGFGDVGFNAVPARQHIPGAAGTRWTPNPPRTPHLDAWAADRASLVLTRAYSGSPVCSPTRSSLLTGRSPDRECVFNAEGCGQQPAWECVDPMPFPASVPTVARSLQAAGYATMHLGKFHLGDFFPKANPDPSYAYKKWPVMHPGIIGFDDWFSTEASAASTTLNCGCDAAWPLEPPGCVLGGGEWTLGKSLACTNFWSPTDAGAPVPACHSSTTSTLACVTNSSVKVQGDSTVHMLERLGAFINASVAAEKPFFAALELHTNHLPHPSLPEFYHSYNGSDGLPAGDYLGTLSQMDAGLGELRQLLADAGVAGNTLVWYSADNGPHPGSLGDGAGAIRDVQTATNGLRQCKASVFEGGIRVPSFVSWPGVITANAVSDVPVFTPDIYPTLLELIGIPYPEPLWSVDGESVLGLLRSGGAAGAWARARPLVWRLEAQVALMDATGRYKLVKDAGAGQCKLQPTTYSLNGTWLFDLLADPTESAPINAQQPALLAQMQAQMAAFEASIAVSETQESGCLPPAAGNGTSVLLVAGGARCLGAAAAAEHAALTVDAANCGWGAAAAPAAALTAWLLADADGRLVLANATEYGLHPLGAACADGTQVVLGAKEAGGFVALDAAAGTLSAAGRCPGKCVTAALALAGCGEPAAQGVWSARNETLRGRYLRPYD